MCRHWPRFDALFLTLQSCSCAVGCAGWRDRGGREELPQARQEVLVRCHGVHRLGRGGRGSRELLLRMRGHARADFLPP